MDMDMTSNVPGWLTPVAWAFIASSLLSAALIAVDVRRRRGRRPWTTDDVVRVCSALYLGPLAVVLHRRHVRREAATTTTAGSGLPGGSASALAHLIGVPLVVASGLTIAGIDLWVMIIVIGVVAIALLAVHERLAPGARRTVPVALGVAVVTVLAFDVGMVGWMLLLHTHAFMPPPSDGVFWFLMQLGVLVGLATGYPVVRWLAGRERSGVPAVGVR